MTDPTVTKKSDNRNRSVALICTAVFSGMIGLSFAAVPLYDMFCRVTGYGGTTQRVDQYSDVILDQTVKVRFDSNVSPHLPWEFTPKTREIQIRIGETAEAVYLAKNTSNVATAGTASFNVAPLLAGAYFNKLECFCFTEQVLQPGETYEMPVQFFVDPEIINVPELRNITTITLSYTFHPLTKETADVQTKAATDRIGG